MIVHRIAQRLAWGEWLEILPGELQGAGDARVDVVALLEVDVFEEVSTDYSGRDGVAVHVDSRQLRNRAFHGHEALAQVFVDCRVHLFRSHGDSCTSGAWRGNFDDSAAL